MLSLGICLSVRFMTTLSNFMLFVFIVMQVEKGKEELVIAEDYKKKSRKKKIILAVVAAGVVIVIIIVSVAGV